jgi:hypothetical protein
LEYFEPATAGADRFWSLLERRRPSALLWEGNFTSDGRRQLILEQISSPTAVAATFWSKFHRRRPSPQLFGANSFADGRRRHFWEPKFPATAGTGTFTWQKIATATSSPGFCGRMGGIRPRATANWMRGTL